MEETKFACITNKVFYPYEKEGTSILEGIKKKDGKVILILYILYTRKDIKLKTYISLKNLIKACNYKPEVKENKDSFKDVLYKLRTLKLINFEGDIKRIDCELNIDCNNLLNNDDGYYNFFKLDEEEINLIRSNSTNNQNFITNLKVYCYLKARVQKIDAEKDIVERGMGEAEVTWRSYEDITKHTGVSSVEKSINKLKDIGLIKYINPGMKIKNNKITNCSNIYALTRVSKKPELELKEGLKQYTYKLKQEGWGIVAQDICIKKYQSEGGTKSTLKQKINKGTATQKEIDKYIKLENKKKQRDMNKKKQDEEFKKKIGLT